MLIREKNLKDEYQDLVAAELAKKEAEEKALAEVAEKASGVLPENESTEIEAVAGDEKTAVKKGRKIKKPRKNK